MLTLQDRLRVLRTTKGLTQNQVAESIGIARNSVYNYETSERKPDADTIVKFAKFFNVSTDYLLGNVHEFGVMQEENLILKKRNAELEAKLERIIEIIKEVEG